MVSPQMAKVAARSVYQLARPSTSVFMMRVDKTAGRIDKVQQLFCIAGHVRVLASRGARVLGAERRDDELIREAAAPSDEFGCPHTIQCKQHGP